MLIKKSIAGLLAGIFCLFMLPASPISAEEAYTLDELMAMDKDALCETLADKELRITFLRWDHAEFYDGIIDSIRIFDENQYDELSARVDLYNAGDYVEDPMGLVDYLDLPEDLVTSVTYFQTFNYFQDPEPSYSFFINIPNADYHGYPREKVFTALIFYIFHHSDVTCMYTNDPPPPPPDPIVDTPEYAENFKMLVNMTDEERIAYVAQNDPEEDMDAFRMQYEQTLFSYQFYQEYYNQEREKNGCEPYTVYTFTIKDGERYYYAEEEIKAFLKIPETFGAMMVPHKPFKDDGSMNSRFSVGLNPYYPEYSDEDVIGSFLVLLSVHPDIYNVRLSYPAAAGEGTTAPETTTTPETTTLPESTTTLAPETTTASTTASATTAATTAPAATTTTTAAASGAASSPKTGDASAAALCMGAAAALAGMCLCRRKSR
ncbi:MAG: hypothetical protein E7511_06445 [Ruminococcus sp.]|nr:hypothetical protein [Ruminococcus sp.]